MLKNKNWKKRVEAIEVMGNCKGENTFIIEALIPMLKDPKAEIRWITTQVLSQLGDKRAIEPLINLLKVEENGKHWWIGKALTKLGPLVVLPLLEVVKDPNVQVRAEAISVLGQLGDKRVVESLIDALNDTNEVARCFAAVALGNLGDMRAVGPLLKLLKDESEDVRWLTATALGNLGDKRAIEPLIETVNDKLNTVNYAAAEALVKLLESSPQTLELLLKLVDSVSADVRFWVVTALGDYVDIRALAVLEQIEQYDTAVNQYQESIAIAATQAIGKIKALNTVSI